MISRYGSQALALGFTERQPTTRIISARQATAHERRDYGELTTIKRSHFGLGLTRISVRQASRFRRTRTCLATGLASVKSIRTAWEKAREAAGLDGFQLCDLRHEAACRFEEAGLANSCKQTPELLPHADDAEAASTPSTSLSS